MDSLGERLRKGREEKNVSLDEVVKATKINKGTLTALENDNHEFLPPMVFVRGFIRNYARYVGLDEKELLDLYHASCDSKRVCTTPEELKGRRKTKLSTIILFLVLLLGLALLLAYPYFLKDYFKGRAHVEPRKKNFLGETANDQNKEFPFGHLTDIPEDDLSLPAKRSPRSGTAPALENHLSAGTPSSSEGKAVATVSPVPSAPPQPIKMKATCYSTTWIGYVIDNGQRSQIFLFPGDEFFWEWNEKIELKLGNAGGIKVAVNGVPLKLLGKSGEVLSVVFGRDTIALQNGEPQNLELWKEEGEPHSGGR